MSSIDHEYEDLLEDVYSFQLDLGCPDPCMTTTELDFRASTR